MRFKNLDLNLLVALDTLIRVRNVSRAADEMFITQSAMSNALGRLRDYFDDPLLIQVGRSMELSPLAASLELPLRDIIVRIEAAVVSTPSFIPHESTRSINLIVSDYTLNTIMPPFLRQVSALAPGVQIHFQPQQNYPHLLLERGEADLLVAPSDFCSTNHPSEPFLEDQICCVVDVNGPLAEGPMTEKDFLEAGHVVMQPPNGGETFAQRACDKLGLKIKVEASTFSFSSLPFLIRGSKRIAMVQRSLAECMLNLGGIRIMDPPFPLPPLLQCLQWHSYRTRDPALVWFRSQMHEAAARVRQEKMEPDRHKEHDIVSG
ncbi:LysR substrate-binding domain-containing protein [Agrobacterium vitis]|uniref:LysR substrate-binding domain-containing protein n=1 Tax=Allorhizobium ampelinum TaxID=3025782 RepID=UPI001F298158|nr:LysR substrate-binding domain-containing protein [Allorhizobium ampelinum]MCF1445766.1 LysR family transcriptional regulator [Allorhizobium ampelinum]